jgi:hypothetical protein
MLNFIRKIRSEPALSQHLLAVYTERMAQQFHGSLPSKADFYSDGQEITYLYSTLMCIHFP